MAPIVHVLFEHATGYSLFAVKEFEEVSTFLPQVERAVLDLSKFKSSIVSLAAFAPFKTAVNALENINAVSEGLVHEDLQLFLETNLPKKKSKFTLGLGDAKLAATINEQFGYSCTHVGIVPEVLRGIRLHFAKLIEDLSEYNCSKAQLGLGHSYSRSKVKFNVNRVDNMIIQSIAILDQLDKDINVFAMRVREWYSYHYPELVKIVNDNHMYAKVCLLVKDRKNLENEEVQTKLEELLMDAVKTQAIVDAARASMGMDISPIDLANIEMFASRVISLSEYRKRLMDYLRLKMHDIAPNLTAIVGESIGARLISKAGSLINLAKYPASTVQILGAEKALFRAMKTRGNTPKYGLLFHSTYIGRAQKRDKGRIARYVSNKCSIASRIDCFTDEASAVFGEKLRDQIEERLKFYETGEVPRKNVDVMIEAEVEAKAAVKAAKKLKKKEKKKRKAAEAFDDEDQTNGDESMLNGTLSEGKENGNIQDAEEEDREEKPKKKKRKAKKSKKQDDDDE